MNITGLDITNFGKFQNFQIPGISPRLTVIRGSQGAGKSLLRAFIRMVLFKIPTPAELGGIYYYRPNDHGQMSGRISLEYRGQPYTVIRMPKQVTVSGIQRGEEPSLEVLTGNISEAVFQNVFSVSMEELSDMASLTQNKVNERIFSAQLALNVNYMEVDKAIKDSLGKIWGARSAGTLRELVNTLEKQDEDLKTFNREIDSYSDLCLEESSLASYIESTGEEIKGLGDKLRFQNQLSEFVLPWGRLQSVEQRIKQYQDLDGFPNDGKKRFEELSGKRITVNQAIRYGDAHSDFLQGKIDGIEVNHALKTHDITLQKLSQEIVSYRDSVIDLPDQEKNLKECKQKIEIGLRNLGESWSQSKVLHPFDFEEIRRRLQELGGPYSDAKLAFSTKETQINDKKKDLRDAEREFKTANEQLDKITNVSGKPSDELETSSKRFANLRESIANRQRCERDITNANIGLVTRPSSRPFLPVVFLGLFGLFSVGILFLVNEIVAIVGAVFLSLFGSYWVITSRLAAQKLVTSSHDSIQEQLLKNKEKLESDLKSFAKEIEELQDLLDLEKTPDNLEITTALENIDKQAKERKRFEEQMGIAGVARKKVEDVKKDLSELESELRGKNNQLLNSSEKWKNFLEELSFKSELDQVEAERMVGHLETTGVFVNQANDLSDRIWRMTEKIRSVETDLATILTDLDRDPLENRHALSMLEALDKMALENRKNGYALQELTEQRDSWVNARKATLMERGEIQDSIDRLIKDANCQTEEEFLKKAAEYSVLLSEKKSRDEILYDHPPLGRATYKEVLENDPDGTGITATIAELQEILDGLKEQKDELISRHTTVKSAREAKEEENPIGKIQLEISSSLEQIKLQQREWAKYKIADILLSQYQEEYRLSREGPLFDAASNYFSEMTNKEYNRINSIPGEKPSDSRFETIDFKGIPKDIKFLNRGHKQQLLLAIRFGLIEQMTHGNDPMPIILDDILESLDDDCREATIRTIIRLSEKHQVIFLTNKSLTGERLQVACKEECLPQPKLIDIFSEWSTSLV